MSEGRAPQRMHIIVWLLIGLVAGALARMIVPTAIGGGMITDIIVGIIGAFIGGWVVTLFGGPAAGGFVWQIIVAIIGAVIFLWLVRLIRRTA